MPKFKRIVDKRNGKVVGVFDQAKFKSDEEALYQFAYEIVITKMFGEMQEGTDVTYKQMGKKLETNIEVEITNLTFEEMPE